MTWRIDLTASAVKQLSKLDKSEARRITAFLRERGGTLDDPRTLGKPSLDHNSASSSDIALVTIASSATSKTAHWSFSSSRLATAETSTDRPSSTDKPPILLTVNVKRSESKLAFKAVLEEVPKLQNGLVHTEGQHKRVGVKLDVVVLRADHLPIFLKCCE